MSDSSGISTSDADDEIFMDICCIIYQDQGFSEIDQILSKNLMTLILNAVLGR